MGIFLPLFTPMVLVNGGVTELDTVIMDFQPLFIRMARLNVGSMDY